MGTMSLPPAFALLLALTRCANGDGIDVDVERAAVLACRAVPARERRRALRHRVVRVEPRADLRTWCELGWTLRGEPNLGVAFRLQSLDELRLSHDARSGDMDRGRGGEQLRSRCRRKRKAEGRGGQETGA